MKLILGIFLGLIAFSISSAASAKTLICDVALSWHDEANFKVVTLSTTDFKPLPGGGSRTQAILTAQDVAPGITVQVSAYTKPDMLILIIQDSNVGSMAQTWVAGNSLELNSRFPDRGTGADLLNNIRLSCSATP